MVADRQTQSDDAAEQGAWARPVSARHGEVVVALTLLAAAGFFISQSLPLSFGRVGLPGPGFFPFVLGIALGLCALAILVRTLLDKVDGKAVFVGHRDVLIALAALVGVATTFDWADSYLTLGVFASVLLLFIARAAPWRVALGATLGMVAVWLVFRLALGVRLPAGEFWQQGINLIATMLPFGQF